MQLVDDLKGEIVANDTANANGVATQIRRHTAAAKTAVNDPVWVLASSIPGLGPNLSAVSEMARSADDVATLGLTPLTQVIDSLDWDTLLPGDSPTNLAPLEAASPAIVSAAQAVRSSAERLEGIDSSRLVPQLADPLEEARSQLRSVTGALDASADASKLLPSMLGSQGPKNYLLMVQNNAEARASGGIPGALAVLSFDKGKLTLSAQNSAANVGAMSPILPIDAEQKNIYSGRLGKYMQDVNLTPDFPTAATLATEMWNRKTGQRVDGVLSIDPVALSYILKVTGPVTIKSHGLQPLTELGLPSELNEQNVVQTLLSDVYAKIEKPEQQDIYFAGVAQEIFRALSSGKGDAKLLVEGISQATAEGRVLVWSGTAGDQTTISKYPLSGSVTGVSISPAQFGVYFNDGTGAKMDYYLKRTVQLIKECPKDGYEQTTVRITSKNTAPSDAATSLAPYVTGGGEYGIPPGTVQTNIVAYGPVQALVESANENGQKIAFAPHLHANRPVGVIAQRLAPGESKTVEFTFGKIVQHTEPELDVTPSVQPVKEVKLPTKLAPCQ
ncbi:DUF4012 domain-containing protein [Pseudarthrobacter sp. 1G09]|uniref:DUF4012 domain-containing protein n=1 Tax=Pseudarthrobacter sp. 1G09 TaxID=3416178 RepID=UPI003CF4AA4E